MEYYVLISIAIIGFVFTLLASYPGHLTPDSVYQLQQALGKTPLTDWHQPGMSLTWQLLINITGKVWSLLILQLVFYWTAFGLLAIIIRKRTNRLILGLTPLLFAFLPTSIDITGMYTKDVLMSVVLCLLASFIYMGSFINKKSKKALYVYILSVALIIYAGNLRYNILPVLLPLAYAASYNFFTSNRKTLLASIIILITVQVSIMTTGRVFNVEASKGQAAVIVDDLKSILSEKEIMNSSLKSDTKEYIIEIKNDCNKKQLIANSTFMCGDISAFRSVSVNDINNIQKTWVTSFVEKPLTYIKFRMAVFWRFITQTKPLTPSTIKNDVMLFSNYTQDYDLGFVYLTPKYINDILSTRNGSFFEKSIQGYSNFTQREIMFLYRPYFWGVVGIALLVFHRIRLSRAVHTYPALATLTCGIMYLFTYIPLATDYSFRFIYWTVLSIGITFSIFIAEYKLSKNRLRSVILINKPK